MQAGVVVDAQRGGLAAHAKAARRLGIDDDAA
jgi:hypothetical protein